MHSSSYGLEAEVPSQTPPRSWKRKFKPRTVTGCTTCRIRRIKCDEAGPSCKQCLRGRRTCDGYRRKDPTDRHVGQDSTLLITSPLSPALFDITQETRCFDFFCHRTVPRLSGAFESPFWNRLLLQAIHHEPAIRHAAVALGSLHECFELGSSRLSENDGVFALQQYVKAIGFVTAPIREKGKQAADVALMTCVLFICFETLRGYHSAALSHIDGGVRIISELQSSQPIGTLCLSPTPYVPLPILNEIFSRLDTQASQIAQGRPRHLLRQELSTNESGYDPHIPATFDSFESARNSLHHISTSATQMAQSIRNAETKTDTKSRPTLPVEAAEIKLSLDLIQNFSIIRLKQWSSAFDDLLQARRHLNKVEHRAVSILKLHRVMLGLNFSVDIVRAMSDDMMWDEYLQSFKSILLYSEEVVNSMAEGKKIPTFALDTEIVLPLYFAAVKCRHGRLRRKAIALLRQVQRQEGVWNSFLAARVAERLMVIEEEGLNKESVEPEEVLRWKRVLGVEVSFETEHRRASLKYLKLRVDGGLEEMVEWVEWDGKGRPGCNIGAGFASRPQSHPFPRLSGCWMKSLG